MDQHGLHETDAPPRKVCICEVCGQAWPCNEEMRRLRASQTAWIVALGRAMKASVR